MPHIIAEEGTVYLGRIDPLRPLLTLCSDPFGQSCLFVRPQGKLLLSMPYYLYRQLEKGSEGSISPGEIGGIVPDLLTKSVELGAAFFNKEARIHDFMEDCSFPPGNNTFFVKRKDFPFEGMPWEGMPWEGMPWDTEMYNTFFVKRKDFPFEGMPWDVGMHNLDLGLFFPPPSNEKADFLSCFFSDPPINDYLEEIDNYLTSREPFDQFLRVASPGGEILSVFTSFPLYQSLVETLRLYANTEYGTELLRRHEDRDRDELVFLD